MIHDTILETIGRTPLVRLGRVVEPGCAEVVAKLEYFAPGGSVKDRAALAMVLDGERSGRLKRGTAIVEASAGNTGVGIALVCAVRGYPCTIVLPEGTSSEKIAVLTALGAEVVFARADVEPSDPQGYIGRAEVIAKERGAFLPDQFDNPANPDAHYRTTGPELLTACDGRLDAFVACVGSGGTLGGTARYLRERLPEIRIVGAAPDASACAGVHGNSLVEGVVEDLSYCMERGICVDEVIAVTDRDAVAMTLRLARLEGILSGASAGVAVTAALTIARQLGPARRVSVIIPDTGRNYLSTYFSATWRSARGL